MTADAFQGGRQFDFHYIIHFIESQIADVGNAFSDDDL